MSSLLSLTIENYRSFCSSQTLSFGEEEMRPITGIYGPNAGGKSNVARALELMKHCVHNSADASWKLPYDPFLLREGKEADPSRFEIRFRQADQIYLYSFSYNGERIVSEILKERSPNTEKMKTIFSRDEKGALNASAEKFGFGKKLLAKTRPETLLITKGREDNNRYSNVVFDFFYNIVVELDDSNDRSALFVELLKGNEGLRNKTLALLKACDFSIRDIKIESVSIPEELMAVLPLPDDVKRDMELAGGTSFRTVHAVRDGERSITGTRELDFWSQESAGTQRFFKTAVPIIAALGQGGIVYLDEFGASMHPMLVEALMELFLKEGGGGAKLVFNTHDTTIMKSLLRREDIVLVEKNSSEESVVTPLMRRGVREGEAIEKRYREGLYGGVPLIRKD